MKKGKFPKKNENLESEKNLIGQNVAVTTHQIRDHCSKKINSSRGRLPSVDSILGPILWHVHVVY